MQKLHHPTADDVWKCVSEQLPQVNMTTIYRNLNRMVEEGELLRFMTSEGIMHFDSIKEDHYHLHCVSCGEIIDIDLPQFERIENFVRDKEHFEIRGHKQTLTGLCSKCRLGKNNEGISQKS